MSEHVLWVEKYRPKKISDTILPTNLKKTFQQFVDQGMVPNLLLSGAPGVGKTTVAKAMLDELECDYIVINGSMNGNIDTLRNEIKDFASTKSFSGTRKYVILDEADYLNAQSTQPALRNFMEEFSSNCGFILTVNIKNRVIAPLQSRCSVVDFKIEKSDAPALGMEFMKRIVHILKSENVEYDPAVIAQLITKHFPDFRRVINELQRYAATGKIDTGILSNFSDENFKKLIELVKSKSFTEIRKWVVDNSDVDPLIIMRKFYDGALNLATPSSAAEMVLILADYQYKAAFVVDQEINLVACLLEMMVRITWK